MTNTCTYGRADSPIDVHSSALTVVVGVYNCGQFRRTWKLLVRSVLGLGYSKLVDEAMQIGSADAQTSGGSNLVC